MEGLLDSDISSTKDERGGGGGGGLGHPENGKKEVSVLNCVQSDKETLSRFEKGRLDGGSVIDSSELNREGVYSNSPKMDEHICDNKERTHPQDNEGGTHPQDEEEGTHPHGISSDDENEVLFAVDSVTQGQPRHTSEDTNSHVTQLTNGVGPDPSIAMKEMDAPKIEEVTCGVKLDDRVQGEMIPLESETPLNSDHNGTSIDESEAALKRGVELEDRDGVQGEASRNSGHEEGASLGNRLQGEAALKSGHEGASLEDRFQGEAALNNLEELSTETEPVGGVEREEPVLIGEADSNRGDLMSKLVLLERDNKALATQLAAERNKETSFQEIAKELEVKCFNQQEKIEDLQLERGRETEKAQQVAKQHSNAVKEKEVVIGKLSNLQDERRKLIDQITDSEKKERELSKENDKLEVLVKKQRVEVLKLQSSLEKSEGRCSQLTQELTKGREEVNSLNIKIKWTQNKLKSESEAHKNMKSQFEATTKKLNQSREEGEQIRTNLKQMIQQYQESEDMRSNSLGIKLKKMERELKQQEQEIADQHELHELTVKELELTKTAHKIAQEEVHQHKQKISDMTSRASEFIAEVEELKGKLTAQKQDKKKQTAEMSELEQRTNTFEKERIKFAQLREVFTQLQKSHQHLEKELEKRKEKESELLAFSAKLSSSNAELTAERSDWEAKVVTLSSELDTLTGNLAQTNEAKEKLEEDIKELNETNHSEMSQLLDEFEGKNRALEQLSIALEDEREHVKAVRKKNSNTIKDLQRQLQSSKRRIEHLEASIASESEPPATLPMSPASSQLSLNGAPSTSSSAVVPQQQSPLVPHDMGLGGGGVPGRESVMAGDAATIIPFSSDDERGGMSSSPEYKFHNMDQEKILLVEKLCQLKKEQVKQEDKVEFCEEHIAQLTEDIQKKSRIIQSFIMREQTGVLTPPSFDENKQRQVKKGGVMGSVFSGKNARPNMMPEVNHELSLEMNRKMQSVLEDTLLKNITLKENIDTLGREIQRISAQLQTYEKANI